MGYYTRTTDIDFSIDKDKLDAAYKAVCALNWRNDLKSGGRYPQNKDLPDDQPREDKWFSWMDWNYHETCKDLSEVLNQLGFETYYTEEGALYIGGYDSKSGDEDKFINVLVAYAHEGGYICWVGEDGALYKWQVEDGQLVDYYMIPDWTLCENQPDKIELPNIQE